uniref:Figainin 1 n=1 Tax=Boana raniceps TaxID=192750 RepID=FIG01_BOARA|nr:RecName: Full=Figainin 1; AltName: Full=Br24; Flags: Precursor [Boana raniceps]AVG44202.1 figainin-01 precursor [Boana raniceps]
MAFLKKSLFLVLFLGLVSLSIGEEEKREEEEKNEEGANQEENAENKEKRFIGTLIPLALGALTKLFKG